MMVVAAKAVVAAAEAVARQGLDDVEGAVEKAVGVMEAQARRKPGHLAPPRPPPAHGGGRVALALTAHSEWAALLVEGSAGRG